MKSKIKTVASFLVLSVSFYSTVVHAQNDDSKKVTSTVFEKSMKNVDKEVEFYKCMNGMINDEDFYIIGYFNALYGSTLPCKQFWKMKFYNKAFEKVYGKFSSNKMYAANGINIMKGLERIYGKSECDSLGFSTFSCYLGNLTGVNLNNAIDVLNMSNELPHLEGMSQEELSKFAIAKIIKDSVFGKKTVTDQASAKYNYFYDYLKKSVGFDVLDVIRFRIKSQYCLLDKGFKDIKEAILENGQVNSASMSNDSTSNKPVSLKEKLLLEELHKKIKNMKTKTDYADFMYSLFSSDNKVSCIYDKGFKMNERVSNELFYVVWDNASKAWRWSDGKTAQSCLGYKMPKDDKRNPKIYLNGKLHDLKNGYYLVGNTKRWCEMNFMGGGWTLVAMPAHIPESVKAAEAVKLSDIIDVGKGYLNSNSSLFANALKEYSGLSAFFPKIKLDSPSEKMDDFSTDIPFEWNQVLLVDVSEVESNGIFPAGNDKNWSSPSLVDVNTTIFKEKTDSNSPRAGHPFINKSFFRVLYKDKYLDFDSYMVELHKEINGVGQEAEQLFIISKNYEDFSEKLENWNPANKSVNEHYMEGVALPRIIFHTKNKVFFLGDGVRDYVKSPVSMEMPTGYFKVPETDLVIAGKKLSPVSYKDAEVNIRNVGRIFNCNHTEIVSGSVVNFDLDLCGSKMILDFTNFFTSNPEERKHIGFSFIEGGNIMKADGTPYIPDGWRGDNLTVFKYYILVR